MQKISSGEFAYFSLCELERERRINDHHLLTKINLDKGRIRYV